MSKGAKRLGFEFFSIVVAVVLAMGLTEWRQNVLNKQQSQISFENILDEIRNSTEDLEQDSSKIADDIETIRLWLRTSPNERDTVNLSIGFNFSFLSSSAWEVAKLNQSMTFLENEKVMDLSGIYQSQEFYEASSSRLFSKMGELIQVSDRESSEYEKLLRGVLFRLNLTYGGIVAYLGAARRVLDKYTNSSEQADE